MALASGVVAALAILDEEEEVLEVRNAFEELSECEFRRRFRFSKRTRAVGSEEFIGLSQPSVSDTIHEVAHAIAVVGGQKRWVAFPETSQAKERTKASFARLGRIPGVLGRVDGTLIAIQKPHGLSPGDTANYMSRKGFYALNTMITCDADLWILDINPCFPGSCHDSWVWRRSSLRRHVGAELRLGECLLGDSGYPLEPWLMTPVLGRPASGTPESEYNKAHTTMHNVVERCIGVLKSRFRCLQRYRTLLYNLDKAATIIASCAALHNIAMAAREPVPEGDDDDTDDDDDSEVPPAADEPPPPQEQGPARRLLHLKGQQQRSRVVNLFRGPRTPHAAHLRRVRSRLQRPRQRCVVAAVGAPQ
ncbi:putative nuclease HARBI1 [Rhipicephalus sanguineus]|uniref:putative nuclease HARBI1 n=1 Tax=Rhipicephalus sanguineus TaxID=34632 RepID=UPI0020C3F60D|nr:putative nuclease HARBI1 [Rhipicephalus sanguineus]